VRAEPLARMLLALKAAGLDLDARELADALFLAPRLRSAQQDDREPGPKIRAPPLDREVVADAKQRDTSRSESPPARTDVARLTPERPTSPTTKPDRVFPFRSPTGRALPEPLRLARALRPLRRRRPSPHLRVLDELATARFIAHTGVWLPHLKPAPERWLSLALVTDGGTSMRVWHPVVRELLTVLETSGFRDVRLWQLETEGGSVALRRPDRRGSSARPRDPRELIDAAGRRVVAVVSDCVSSGWHDGSVARLMDLWGAHAPVVILQVLPERLWSATALALGWELSLRCLAPVAPNARLRSTMRGLEEAGLRPEDLREDAEPHGTSPCRRVPVVVVPLDARGMSRWASFVDGRASTIRGYLLPEGDAQDEARSRPPSTADERVQLFLATASPLARQLAALLSTVPVTLPILRLLRAAVVPRAGLAELAEVFLGGLLRQTGAGGGDPDSLGLDFHPGVRERLRATLPSGAAMRALEVVTAYIGERAGHSLDFPAFVELPTPTDARRIAAADRAFALLSAKDLRRIGLVEAARILEEAAAPPEERGEGGGRARARDGAVALEPGESPTELADSAERFTARVAGPDGGGGERSVTVIGSGSVPLDPPALAMARALGAALARGGFILVAGGWPGVDLVCREAFERALSAEAMFGTRVIAIAPSDRDGRIDALRRSAAVVVIGGQGATGELFRIALHEGVFALPIPGTGGDAERAFSDLWDRMAPPERKRLLAPVNVSIRTDDDAERVAASVVRLIGESVRSSAGTAVALGEDRTLMAAFDRVRAACITVETLGSQGGSVTGLAIAPDLFVTASAPFRGSTGEYPPFLAIGQGHISEKQLPARVLGTVEPGDLLVLRAVGESLATLDRATDVMFEVERPRDLAAFGWAVMTFVGGDLRIRAGSASLVPYSLYFGAKVVDGAAGDFLGAPVVTREGVVGVVVSIDEDRGALAGERTQLTVAGSHLLDAARMLYGLVASQEGDPGLNARPGTPIQSAGVAPAELKVDWALRVLNAVALEFHMQGFASAPFGVPNLCASSSQTEENDFRHVKRVAQTLFTESLPAYLDGKDPSRIGSEISEGEWREALASAPTKRALSPPRHPSWRHPMTDWLRRLLAFALPDERSPAEEALGMPLEKAVSLVEAGLFTDADVARRLESVRPLVFRFQTPFHRSFLEFPTTLQQSREFPSYLGRFFELWLVLLGRIEAQLGEESTVAVRYSLDEADLEDLQRVFPKAGVVAGEIVASAAPTPWTVSVRGFREIVAGLRDVVSMALARKPTTVALPMRTTKLPALSGVLAAEDEESNDHQERPA
jgi:hypothetical protein